jgi:hypothetical protein
LSSFASEAGQAVRGTDGESVIIVLPTLVDVSLVSTVRHGTRNRVLELIRVSVTNVHVRGIGYQQTPGAPRLSRKRGGDHVTARFHAGG